MSILVIDLETTANGGPDGDSPEAQYLENSILAWGWVDYDHSSRSRWKAEVTTDEDKFWAHIRDTNPHTIVAHNAKFDYKWLLRTVPRDLDKWIKHVSVLDTMTSAYLMSGKKHKMLSLEDLYERTMGCKGAKTMDLGEYLGSGGKMEAIPKSDLLTYLEQDVYLLRDVVDKLYDVAPSTNYIKALAMMEMKGLPLSHIHAETEAKKTSAACDAFVNLCEKWLIENAQWINGKPIEKADFLKKINPTAPRTLSFILTGTPEILNVTSAKSGKLVKKDSAPDPIVPAKVLSAEPTNLGYPMAHDDVEHYKAIAERDNDADATAILLCINDWRTLDKLLNTYYYPFLTAAKHTGCIHPKLNTAVTATGRLSSSAPNGQNIPPEARKLIRSCSPDMTFVDADFQQLELIALAKVCKDARLNADIRAGVDIHYMTGKTVFGWRDPLDMRKDERRKVKNLNFGVVYGGHPKGLAKQTGFDIKIVEKLRNELLTRYPGIETWQEELLEEVKKNSKPAGIDEKGVQMYESTVYIGGLPYCFKQYPTKYEWLRRKEGPYTYNNNQIFNYGIQGYAGHLIMMTYLEMLHAMLYCDKWAPKWDHHLYEVEPLSDTMDLLMTVHDSILVQCRKEEVLLLKKAMVECARYVQKLLDLPELKLDFQVEDHWT